MNTNQRYLIAKYVSDVRRMEPRNIGVVLWANGRVALRFLSQDDVPFVNEKRTYARWVQFWEQLASKASITPRDGEPVERKNPQFLDALQKTQKGNYLLHEGGYVADRLLQRDVDNAAQYLFEELVIRQDQAPANHRNRQRRLKLASERIFEVTGLSQRPGFHRDYKLACRVGSVETPFTLSYGLGNGTPEALYQTVRLKSDQSVHDAAFMFEWLLKSQTIPAKEKCAALVRTKADDPQSAKIETSLEMLAEFATVVDLAQPNDAARAVLRIAGNGSHDDSMLPFDYE
jgi:hypothetical protein